MNELRRLLILVTPHWTWLALGVLLGVIAIGANIALMALSAYLISRAALATSVAEVALAVTGVRVLAISRAGSRYLERLASHRVMFRILSTVRVWFYTAIEPLAPARLVRRRSGDLLTRSVADVDALEDFYIRVLIPPLVAALVVAGISVIYGLFDIVLGLVLAGFLVLTGVALPLLTRSLSRTSAAALADARGELGASVVDEVRGVADLVALDAAGAHHEQLLARGAEMDRIRARLGTLEGISSTLAGLFASLAGMAILALAIPMVSSGELEGVFLAVLPLAAIAAFEAVQPLARSLQLADSTRESARRLFELIDDRPAVVDPRAPLPIPQAFDVRIEGLSFRYDELGPWVLRGLDLHVDAGERVALVGPSGCGKSTLLSLLLRFWEYDEGSISIGGTDIRGLDQDAARALLSVVPQDVHLFSATIEDNLAVADAEVDPGAMARACRLAQLHDFIESLPNGYDTPVGEDGLLLSGGERRRLAIARAVLKDAPIVILDEVTADLDSSTEHALWPALDAWLAGKTVLVISHRPTIAAHVDRVVQLGG
jgi:ATP-binding cassette subfamily C protein CydC